MPARKATREKAEPRRPKAARAAALIVSAIAAVALLAWGALSLTQSSAPAKSALGQAAYQHTRKLVELGPREPGSAAHAEMEKYIAEQLRAAGFSVETDPFTVQTPAGPVQMVNIVGKIHSRQRRIIALSTHYDTKLERDFRFVGANDGGSGTGLLLALAPLLAKENLEHDVWLVFLDGEETFASHEWNDADALYGSRRLAAKWKADGTASRVGAFILLDMIGDADLDIAYESNSTAWLRDLVWNSAKKLGYSRYFTSNSMAITDDHVPLLQAGVPSLDIIDLNFGPGNSYHHTANDTLDKVSARSLGIVGEVVLDALSHLDK